MNFSFGFADEIVKLAMSQDIPPGVSEFSGPAPGGYPFIKSSGVQDTLKGLGKIISEDPLHVGKILDEVFAGPSGAVAKGIMYGTAGYGAGKGLAHKNPKTKSREPLAGATTGALKGALIGVPAVALLRYPAIRKAVQKHLPQVQLQKLLNKDLLHKLLGSK